MSHVIDKLGKLFGSPARVKILRLFLFNPDTLYDIDDVTSRCKVVKTHARRELSAIIHAGFLKKKSFSKTVLVRGKQKRKKVVGFMANPAFDLAGPLRTLLIESELVQVNELPKRFRNAGRILLFVASGIFTHDSDRMADLLIVGDHVRRNAVDQAIKILESEIGKEVRYALFDLEEYNYRMKMYDKLLRDVFDYPHLKLINKIKSAENG